MSQDYDMMDDIITSLSDCTGLSCAYESFVGMGRPSDPVGENCALIGIWKDEGIPAFRDYGKNIFLTDKYHIRMSRCCGDIDTSLIRNLSAGFDEQLARCFYDDVETVFCCLLEMLPSILNEYGDISCKPQVIDSLKYDDSLLGTCFGAVFTFTITRGRVCCVDPQ